MKSIMLFEQFTIEDRIKQYVDSGTDRQQIKSLIKAEYGKLPDNIDSVIDDIPTIHVAEDGSKVVTIPRSVKKMDDVIIKELLGKMTPRDVFMVRNGGVYFYDEVASKYDLPDI
jgi:hypothetical protein